MTHRFTFKELGHGYFGKNTDWTKVTTTKGRLSDNEILIILLNDRINSLDHYSPIRERLVAIRNNLK